MTNTLQSCFLHTGKTICQITENLVQNMSKMPEISYSWRNCYTSYASTSEYNVINLLIPFDFPQMGANGYIHIKCYTHQEYVYFVGSKRVISKSYKWNGELNISYYGGGSPIYIHVYD